GVDFKGAANPVTEVDLASETAITTVIAGHFPQESILAEEGGGADWRSGRVWIVDPLEGTVNFIHGIAQVSVTVALWNDGEPVVGVTIDVATNEEWVAVKGGGATLNGEPIHVSTTSRLEKALILSGFPYDQADHSISYLDLTRELLAGTMAVRVMGSAALDLAWVAAGRADGYCEHGGPEGIKPWDMAAGALMVAEAGGRFTDHLGEPHRLDS